MKIRIILLFTIFYGSVQAGLFDDRFPSARASAMSGSFVAVSNDVWAGYYNPAGLARVGNNQFGASYQIPFNLNFFRSFFVSGVMPLPENFGTAGVSFQDFGVDFMGNSLSSEYTFAFSHGFYLMKDIHSALTVGYNLKYYYWDLGESVGGLNLGSAGTFGMDVGFQASLYQRTWVGVYFLNLNAPQIGEFTKHDLPQRIVIGAAYMPQNGVTTSISMNKTIGLQTQIEGGFELDVMEYVSIRLGVSTEPNRFSGGIGIHYEGFNFDYALRTHPVLSETHQFALQYSIDN